MLIHILSSIEWSRLIYLLQPSKRVFILGPSHHVYLDGCALRPSPALNTPTHALVACRSDRSSMLRFLGSTPVILRDFRQPSKS